MLTVCEYARAVLHNGLGHYEAALAQQGHRRLDSTIGVSTRAIPELVEAAVRSERRAPRPRLRGCWNERISRY